jgi:hypothetical protein
MKSKHLSCRDVGRHGFRSSCTTARWNDPHPRPERQLLRDVLVGGQWISVSASEVRQRAA